MSLKRDCRRLAVDKYSWKSELKCEIMDQEDNNRPLRSKDAIGNVEVSRMELIW